MIDWGCRLTGLLLISECISKRGRRPLPYIKPKLYCDALSIINNTIKVKWLQKRDINKKKLFNLVFVFSCGIFFLETINSSFLKCFLVESSFIAVSVFSNWHNLQLLLDSLPAYCCTRPSTSVTRRCSYQLNFWLHSPSIRSPSICSFFSLIFGTLYSVIQRVSVFCSSIVPHTKTSPGAFC